MARTPSFLTVNSFILLAFFATKFVASANGNYRSAPFYDVACFPPVDSRILVYIVMLE